MVFERRLSSLSLQELRTRGSGTEGPQGSTEAAAKLAPGLTPTRVRTRGSASAIRKPIRVFLLHYMLWIRVSRAVVDVRKAKRKLNDFSKGQGLMNIFSRPIRCSMISIGFEIIALAACDLRDNKRKSFQYRMERGRSLNRVEHF